MRKLLLLALPALLFAGCGEGEQAELTPEEINAQIEEAFNLAQENIKSAETDEEIAAIIKEFLTAWPESSHTTYSLNGYRHYRGTKLGDLPEVISFAEETRSKISDEEIGRDVDLLLCRMYSQSEIVDKFRELATRLADSDQLNFSDRLDLIRETSKLEAWDIVKNSCALAEQLASAEAFKADYPDRKDSEEDLQKYGKNRKANLLTHLAWLNANTGNVEEALDGFTKANDLTQRNYFSQPWVEGLDVFWGKSLLLAGEYDQAISRLAIAGLDMSNADAWDNMKKAYLAAGYPAGDFTKFAKNAILANSRVLDDFTLPGYDGQDHTLDELAGQATLIVFWHPT